jgi:hypothetical protein
MTNPNAEKYLGSFHPFEFLALTSKKENKGISDPRNFCPP